MIDIQNLSCGYRDRLVIDNISLNINDGRLTALIGPNGSGKSTFIKTVCGAIKPKSGSIKVDGKELTAIKNKDAARLISYLPQGIAAGDTTVEKYVLYGRYPYISWPQNYSEKDREIAKSAEEKFGLSGLSQKTLQQISGGERQKAALALAFAQDAKHVFMDEPASFLDISAQFELMDILRMFACDGKAVLAVLHDIPMALEFADDIVVMDKGSVVFKGSPTDAINSRIIDDVFGIKAEYIGGHYICRPK